MDLDTLLVNLIREGENEVVEFKAEGDSYSTHEIGKYFAALSNEANIRGRDCAWLILGIENKGHAIVGTDYRQDRARLASLKHQITQGTEPSITFREIHEAESEGRRVLMFEIPSAPRGMPIAWQGHYYGRAGESLIALGVDKLDQIRNQTRKVDWSAEIVANGDLHHLDPAALARARESFAQKHASRFSRDQVESWNNEAFLRRAKLLLDDGLTRAAILLLGKEEASPFLLPHPAQMTWKLEAEEKAFEHFHTPFLLNTSRLFQRIRNVQVKIAPRGELIPVEVAKYDETIILEALHNCIAHQDYERNGRILVTEYADRLVFQNEGGFFEGQPMDYALGQKTPSRYRNSFLVQAMEQLNMIDTMGYGIYRMHLGQAKRYFPLPDYDLNEKGVVRATIHGRVIDPSYSRALIHGTDLSLVDILALDRVQKRLPIDDVAIGRLRRAKLIEGRKPNFYVSASVADLTASRATYLRFRGQEDAFCEKLIRDFLQGGRVAGKNDLKVLLWTKLSEALNDEQKENKINNLLTKMRRRGEIVNTGSRVVSAWKLVK